MEIEIVEVGSVSTENSVSAEEMKIALERIAYTDKNSTSAEEPVMEIQLPPNYDYDWNENVLKIKGLSNEGDVKVWMEELSKTSYVTWRVMRTFPYVKEKGRLYRFKKVYRCQHNTYPVNKHAKKSKHTGCPATLTVTIRRKEDKDGIIWGHATFERYHNHPIKDPSSLRYRPISEETKAEIIKLFQKGHTPLSAYNEYTSKKIVELGRVDCLASADRSNFPSKKDFHNLFLKYGDKKDKNMLEALEKYTVEVNAKGYVVCIIAPNKSKNKRKNIKSSDSMNEELIGECVNGVYEKDLNDKAMDDEETLLSIPDVIKSFDMMFHKLKEVVINDPKNMVLPAKNLIKNFEKCSANPSDLVSAMHTAFSAKHLFTKTIMHKKKKSFQQTVSQRTLAFAGKRKPNCVQPAGSTSAKILKEHDCFESRPR